MDAPVVLAVLQDSLGDEAEALRQAQLSIASEREWAAPYYWAGFVLQGDWKYPAG